MIKAIEILFLVVTILLALYLSCMAGQAFIVWGEPSFNVTEWSEEARFFFLIAALFLSLFAVNIVLGE